MYTTIGKGRKANGYGTIGTGTSTCSMNNKKSHPTFKGETGSAVFASPAQSVGGTMAVVVVVAATVGAAREALLRVLRVTRPPEIQKYSAMLLKDGYCIGIEKYSIDASLVKRKTSQKYIPVNVEHKKTSYLSHKTKTTDNQCCGSGSQLGKISGSGSKYNVSWTQNCRIRMGF